MNFIEYFLSGNTVINAVNNQESAHISYADGFYVWHRKNAPDIGNYLSIEKWS